MKIKSYTKAIVQPGNQKSENLPNTNIVLNLSQEQLDNEISQLNDAAQAPGYEISQLNDEPPPYNNSFILLTDPNMGLEIVQQRRNILNSLQAHICCSRNFDGVNPWHLRNCEECINQANVSTSSFFGNQKMLRKRKLKSNAKTSMQSARNRKTVWKSVSPNSARAFSPLFGKSIGYYVKKRRTYDSAVGILWEPPRKFRDK